MTSPDLLDKIKEGTPETAVDLHKQLDALIDYLAFREVAREKIILILPLAKGYVAAHDVGNNKEFIRQAEEFLEISK